MSKLQPNFHLKEFFVGCSLMERQNAYVKPSLMDNIFRMCGIMSVIRSHFQFPFRITSCYRNRAHNLRVNGSSSSQHLNGLAVDFQCQSPEHVANFIIDNVEFDQLIIYDTFIHFALHPTKVRFEVIDKRTKKFYKLNKPSYEPLKPEDYVYFENFV